MRSDAAAVDVLDRELHVVEAELAQPGQPLAASGMPLVIRFVYRSSARAPATSCSRSSRTQRLAAGQVAPARRRAPPPRANTRSQVAVSSSSRAARSRAGFEQYAAAQRAAVRELRDQRVRARLFASLIV